MISIAAPFYVKKRSELNKRHVLLAVLAGLALAVPTVGSFYPVPPFPVDTFPYIFLSWMVVGGSWLFVLNRRRASLFSQIESDLEDSMQASARRHDEEMEKVIPVERPLPPTFEELELALSRAG